MFQGQSTRSKNWFDPDSQQVKEIFITRYPHFKKRMFQSNIKGQSGSQYPTFPVPIRNSKETGEIECNPKDPLL